MTRLGRYPDRDWVDPASESVMAARADGKVMTHDVEVLVAGSLSNASGSPGQRIQKQIGEAGDRQLKEANRILRKAGA